MYKNILLVVCTILVFGMFMQSGTASNSSSSTATAYVLQTIDVTLSYTEGSGIDFPGLVPGSYNNSANSTLNITITPLTNVRTNISQAATGPFVSGSDTLTIDNLIYNNQSIFEHTWDNNVTMTTVNGAPPFPNWKNISKPIGGVPQYRNASYYLTIPENQPAGTYQTNININVTRCTT